MTPQQKLHLCRVLWPQFTWYLDGGGVPTRQVVRANGVWSYEQPSLTSDDAVGRMVAYLWQSERYHSWSYLGDELGTYSDDWREALALLVLEVAGE